MVKQTFLICTDSKHKDRNTILVFIELLFENYIMKDEINNMHDVEEIIWTEDPSTEFKNIYCVETLRCLSEKYSKPFTWKYFTTCHSKGVVDRVGRKCKSIVLRKTMTKETDCITVQNGKEFDEVATCLFPTT